MISILHPCGHEWDSSVHCSTCGEKVQEVRITPSPITSETSAITFRFSGIKYTLFLERDARAVRNRDVAKLLGLDAGKMQWIFKGKRFANWEEMAKEEKDAIPMLLASKAQVLRADAARETALHRANLLHAAAQRVAAVQTFLFQLASIILAFFTSILYPPEPNALAYDTAREHEE